MNTLAFTVLLETSNVPRNPKPLAVRPNPLKPEVLSVKVLASMSDPLLLVLARITNGMVGIDAVVRFVRAGVLLQDTLLAARGAGAGRTVLARVDVILGLLIEWRLCFDPAHHVPLVVEAFAVGKESFEVWVAVQIVLGRLVRTIENVRCDARP